jgi:transcriptional regulator with XRE-family HTH domain
MTRGPFAVDRAFWRQEAVVLAVADRDVAQLFRLVQKQTGATQTRLGELVGLSQAQVSEILSGGRKVSSLDVAARIVTGLSMPRVLQSSFLLGQPIATDHAEAGWLGYGEHADVRQVFANRSEFLAAWPTSRLFDAATTIRTAGLSLNLICQQYPDQKLVGLLAGGTHVSCLLLDPDGEAIKAREREEGYLDGYLSRLNELNVSLLIRLREQLPPADRPRLEIAVYDETIRFNIILVDEKIGFVQPYLPHARGVSSPTFALERATGPAGLYPTFDQIYTTLAARAKAL